MDEEGQSLLLQRGHRRVEHFELTETVKHSLVVRNDFGHLGREIEMCRRVNCPLFYTKVTWYAVERRIDFNKVKNTGVVLQPLSPLG